MATTKVSALAETTTPQSNDELLINQSGVSKKVKITNLPAGTPGTGSISTSMLADDAVTTDKLANSINSAITANTAKTGITSAQASAITANTAKTGITSGQASAIIANTAKVTNATHTGDVTGATTLTIGNDKVITAKILDSNVTTAKIADDAVTVAKLNLISTSSVPSLEAKGTSGSTSGYIQLNCSENSHGIKLLGPPHSASANYTLTFPNNDGDASQVLTTNGSGVMSWATPASSNVTTKGLYEMANTIASNYTIGNNNNAMSAGPITINNGISVTVPSGSTWVIA